MTQLPEIEAGTKSVAEQAAIARASLADSGAVVIRKSFDPLRLLPLLQNVQRHADFLAQSVATGTPRNFPSSYRWVDHSLACDLAVLDPNTGDSGSDDFNATMLCAAVMTELTQAILRGEVGEDAGYALIRARTILPRSGNNGSLALHKEKTAIRFPGVHVVWTPLTPPDIVTNVDAPGIEFRTADGGFSRPTLSAGDVAIFTGEIDHGTYIPKTATHWRVGCDIRIFPWTTENWLPAEAIAAGYGPRRLRWPHSSAQA